MSWDKSQYRVIMLILTGVQVVLWMLCEQKYGWPEGPRTEEARKELLEKMRMEIGL